MSKLLASVKNTVPYLFSEKSTPSTRYVEILKREAGEQSGLSYYEFCVAAHFATVGSFVPTDVDVAIRQKLWRKITNEVDFEPMWNFVQEVLTWDERIVSNRVVMLPGASSSSKKIQPAVKLSGHQGEWLSIAIGAYGTALKVAPDSVPDIRGAIEAVVKQQEEALCILREAFLEEFDIVSARRYLDGVAAVAHNLGDLDRMFDLQELGDLDVLKRRVYRCGHEDARTPREEFLLAGRIYKELLANENHRHFPLREPKSIRQANKFLLNYGPFFDDWGTTVVKAGVPGSSPLLTEGDLREVAESLIIGWKRLNPKSIYTSQGYSRALCGMMAAFPRGRDDLEALVPPVLKKELNEGGLRTLMNVTRAQFEKQWVGKLKRLLITE